MLHVKEVVSLFCHLYTSRVKVMLYWQECCCQKQKGEQMSVDKRDDIKFEPSTENKIYLSGFDSM